MDKKRIKYMIIGGVLALLSVTLIVIFSLLIGLNS